MSTRAREDDGAADEPLPAFVTVEDGPAPEPGTSDAALADHDEETEPVWQDRHVTVEATGQAFADALLTALQPRPGRCVQCDRPLTHPRAGESCDRCRRREGQV